MVHLLEYYRINVLKCFDNDKSKWGSLLWNHIEVVEPYYTNAEELIVICFYDKSVTDKITKQCVEIGFSNYVTVKWEDFREAISELPDKEYLELVGKERTGEYLDIDNPKSFNEKIQWMKLYDRNPLYHKLVDKYAVKEYVSLLIGDEYVIPSYGVWDSFKNINFDILPNSFVLKCTHDSGSVEVIKEKKEIDYIALEKKFCDYLNIDYYKLSREWCYKDVPRRILAEKCINEMDDVVDYKIHCFNGEPKIIQVIGNRDLHAHTAKECFMTTEWKHEELMYHTYDLYETMPHKPENLGEMLEKASILARNLKYVRIDLYNICGKIYFGEYTLNPAAGFGKWKGQEQFLVGSWIDLPIHCAR